MGNFCSMGASRQAKKEAMEDGGIYEKKKPEEPTADTAQSEATKPSIVVSDEQAAKPDEESEGGFLSGATQLISNTGDELKDMAEKEVEEKKKDIEVKADEVKETVATKTEEVKEAVVAKAEEVGQGISSSIAGFKSSADEKVMDAEDSVAGAVESGKGESSDLQSSLEDKTKSVEDSVSAKKEEVSTGVTDAVVGAGKVVDSTKDGAETKLAATKESIETNVNEKVQEAEDAAQDTAAAASATAVTAKESAESSIATAKEKVEIEATQAAETVSETIESAKETADSKIASAKDEVEMGVASAEAQVVAAKEDVEKKVDETTDEVNNKVESVAEAAAAKKEEIVTSVSTAASDAKIQIDSAAEEAKTQIDSAAEEATSNKEEIVAGISTTSAQVKDDVVSAKTAAADEFESKEQEVESAAESAKESVVAEASKAEEELKEIKQGAEEGVASAVEEVGSAVDSAKDTVATGISEAKDTAVAAKKEEVETATGDVAKSVEEGVDKTINEASTIGGEIQPGLFQAANEASDAVVEKTTGAEDEAQTAVQRTAQNVEDRLIEDVDCGAKTVEGMDLLGEIDACRAGEIVMKDTSKELDDLLGSADESLTSGETPSDSLLGDVTPLTASETSQQTDSSIPEVCVENRQEYADDIRPKQIAVTRNSDNTVTTRDLGSESVAVVPESPMKSTLESEGSSVDDLLSGFTNTVKTGITDSVQKVTDLLDSAAGAIGESEDAKTEETVPAETETTQADDETVKRIAAEVTAQAVQQALEVVAAEEANNNIENPELSESKAPVDVLTSKDVTPSMAPSDTNIVQTSNQKSGKPKVQSAESNSTDADATQAPAPVNGNVQEATKDTVVEKKADCSDCSAPQKEAMI